MLEEERGGGRGAEPGLGGSRSLLPSGMKSEELVSLGF